jgi:hypothetical protein
MRRTSLLPSHTQSSAQLSVTTRFLPSCCPTSRVSSRQPHPHSEPSAKRSIRIVDLGISATLPLPQNASGQNHGLARMSYKQAMSLMVEERVRQSQLMQRKLYVSSLQQKQQQQQHLKILSLEESASAQLSPYPSSSTLQPYIGGNHATIKRKQATATQQHVVTMSFNGPTSSRLRASPPPTTPHVPAPLPPASSLVYTAAAYSMQTPTLTKQPAANAAHGHIMRPRSSALADPLLNRFAVHI